MKKVVLVAGVAILGAGLWLSISKPASRPVPDPPAPAALAAAGAPLAQVALPGKLSERAEIGKRAFEAKCAVCHGANAAGQDGTAPPLVHKIYEPNHHGDASFLLAARNGVRAHHWPFGNMPPVEGLTEGDIGNIVTYIRELQRANGIE